MSNKPPKLKIVSVKWDGRTCFRLKSGDVTVTAPPGKKLTNERTLWLLEQAKLDLMLGDS